MPALYSTPPSFLHEASRETGISEDKLYLITRDREVAFWRGIVAYLGREVWGYTVKEI